MVTSHRHFLDFLSRHIGKPEHAEEILQSAFVRALEKGASVRDPEAIVPWFYRLLRNAVIDHYRRRATEAKAQTELTELTSPSFELELTDVVCTCVGALLPNLRGEYAQMLQRVDLENASVAELAKNPISRPTTRWCACTERDKPSAVRWSDVVAPAPHTGVWTARARVDARRGQPPRQLHRPAKTSH
ncbi:MAG: sigma factor [Polyangiaceae bacterium]